MNAQHKAFEFEITATPDPTTGRKTWRVRISISTKGLLIVAVTGVALVAVGAHGKAPPSDIIIMVAQVRVLMATALTYLVIDETALKRLLDIMQFFTSSKPTANQPFEYAFVPEHGPAIRELRMALNDETMLQSTAALGMMSSGLGVKTVCVAKSVAVGKVLVLGKAGLAAKAASIGLGLAGALTLVGGIFLVSGVTYIYVRRRYCDAETLGPEVMQLTWEPETTRFTWGSESPMAFMEDDMREMEQLAEDF